MPRKVVTFDRFDGGEFGKLGEREAPRGAWTGKNVVRLHDGSLCPRSGLVEIAPTGVGVANGTLSGFGVNLNQNVIWWINAFNVYQCGIAVGAPAFFMGALAGTPSNRVMSKFGDADERTYLTSLGDKVYELHHDIPVITAFAGTPGGRVCAIYGLRLIVADDGVTSSRLFFSDPNNFSSFPVANFLDVGRGGQIIALVPSTDRLFIAKTDGTWWMLTGVPGVNDTLRRITRAEAPSPDPDAGPTRWAASGDGRVWMVPTGTNHPASFNGVSIQALTHLSFANGDFYDDGPTIVPTVGATGLLRASDVFLCTGTAASPYDKQGLLRREGVWTKHLFSKNISGFVDGHAESDELIFITDGGTASTPAHFYMWAHGLNRPPFAANPAEAKNDAGTAFTAEFTLPAQWFGNEGEWLIAGVVVEFRKWNHGYGGNNGFTVSVVPLRVEDDPGTTVTATFTEAESAAASSPSTAGVDDVIALAYSDPTACGEGLRVSVSGIVGCAIQRIRVILDDRELRPHGNA